jgi:hypothetical protein
MRPLQGLLASLATTVALSAGLAACSTELGQVRCDTDDNCAPGTWCSAAGFCADSAACAGSTDGSCAVVAPTGLTALGQDKQVSLSWNTTGGAASYVVRRAIKAGGPYSDVVTQAVAGFLDTGLSPGTTYFYVVHAVGPGGPGADSAEASALTLPAAPAHLSASGGTAQISLAWDPVPGATGYRLLRAGPSGVFAKLREVAPTPTTAVDGSLTSGATWSYEVVALNATGPGPASPIASATTSP